jgi:hypothetical protein
VRENLIEQRGVFFRASTEKKPRAEGEIISLPLLHRNDTLFDQFFVEQFSV